MLGRLDELESLIRATSPASPSIGHNHPPEPIDDQPLSDTEREEALWAIEVVRAEASKTAPDETTIQQSVGVFRRIAGWIAERINSQIDNGISLAIGYGIASRAEEIKVALVTSAAVVSEWLTAISGHLF